MSFQAYLDTIQGKTGKTPSDFKELAEKGGFTQNGTPYIGYGLVCVQ